MYGSVVIMCITGFYGETGLIEYIDRPIEIYYKVSAKSKSRDWRVA